MRAEFAYEEAQKYLRQRNRLAVVAGVLGLASLLGLGAAATRDREVVLVPVTSERLSLTSAGPDAHYLELVTRDTALMLLNRSPQGLDYRVEGRRPLSRFVFTLPCVDQLVANDDADGDLLVPGLALYPVSKWAGNVGLKTEMPIHVRGSY